MRPIFLFGISALMILGIVALAGLSAAPLKPDAERFVNYTETLTNNSKNAPNKAQFEMIAVKGGEFLMGSPADEEGRQKDEGPQVKVRVKPFWIGKCEVSWDEFYLYYKRAENQDEEVKIGKPARALEGADAVTRPSTSYVDETFGYEFEKHPVINITHHMAMTYCEWLSKKTGKNYRLPTEAEWEYACRAASTTPFANRDGTQLDDMSWYAKNSKTKEHPSGTTHAVGSKKPNAWGIHDMHGNVMEWCLDHYVEDAYSRFNRMSKEGIIFNPTILPTEKKWSHVARGGSYRQGATELRSANRTGSLPAWMKYDPQEPQSIWWLAMKDDIGFRICRPATADEFGIITSKVTRNNNETFHP